MTKREPKYIKIERYLLELIESKKYKVGDLFPPETKLAEELKVSRMTIRQAINSLVLNGFLARKAGMGTLVLDRSSDKVEVPLTEFKNFTKKAKGQGKTPINKVITFEKKLCPLKIAKKLNIDDKTEIYHIKRVRFLEDKPAVLEDTYMVVDGFEDLTKIDIQKSKYAYIESKGYEIAKSKRVIMAEVPIGEVATLLKLNRNEALLKAESTSYLTNGKVFEYSEIYYSQKEYFFTVEANYIK